MDKYTFLHILPRPEPLIDRLNELAKNGYRVVAVVPNYDFIILENVNDDRTPQEKIPNFSGISNAKIMSKEEKPSTPHTKKSKKEV